MTDIIERLYAKKNTFEEGPRISVFRSELRNPDGGDAVREIEKLRKKNEELMQIALHIISNDTYDRVEDYMHAVLLSYKAVEDSENDRP